jgi:hypothetical protein
MQNEAGSKTRPEDDARSRIIPDSLDVAKRAKLTFPVVEEFATRRVPRKAVDPAQPSRPPDAVSQVRMQASMDGVAKAGGRAAKLLAI